MVWSLEIPPVRWLLTLEPSFRGHFLGFRDVACRKKGFSIQVLLPSDWQVIVL